MFITQISRGCKGQFQGHQRGAAPAEMGTREVNCISVSLTHGLRCARKVWIGWQVGAKEADGGMEPHLVTQTNTLLGQGFQMCPSIPQNLEFRTSCVKRTLVDGFNFANLVILDYLVHPGFCLLLLFLKAMNP